MPRSLDGLNVDDSETNNGRLNWRSTIKIGTWNVKSLYMVGQTKTLVAEMDRYNIDIIAVQETRWLGRGECDLGKHTILYSGRADQRHEEGVGICMTKKIRESLMEYKPISERIMSIRLRGKWFNVTVICVYAPTEEKEERIKDEFYEELQMIIDNTSKHDIMIILGDLNAKVGQEVEAFGPSIGKESLHEETNDNGTRLASLALSNNLVIGGTYFQHKNVHKETWVSPDGHTRNQIDHIIINRKHRNALQDIRSYRGADCNTDHFLVLGRIRAKLSIKKSTPGAKRRIFDTERMKETGIKDNFQLKLTNRFSILDIVEEETEEQGVNQVWEDMFNIVREVSEQEIGFVPRERKNHWFDMECMAAIEERNRARQLVIRQQNNDAQRENYRLKKIETKRLLRRKKRQAFHKEIENIERNRHGGKIRQFYQGVKSIRTGYQARERMIKSKNGEIITGEMEVMERWKEHFEELLNPPTENNLGNNDNRTIQGPEEEMPEISLEEVKRAIKHLRNNKSPGKDGIPSEIWKGGGDILEERLHRLMKIIWTEENIPVSWREGIIIPIHKKDDKLECANYRGISLLSTAYKVFTKILYNRMEVYMEHIVGEYQCGFRRGRSTTDQVFIIRQLIEKYWEYDREQLHLFIDFKQAYDRVNRTSLWKIMEELGIPHKYIRLTRACYENTNSVVRCGSKTTSPFQIGDGLKQGCILSPLLFNLAMEKVIRDSMNGRDEGIKLEDINVKLLAYADDVDIMIENQTEMKNLATLFKEAAERIGLKINESKTKVMKISREPILPERVEIAGMDIGRAEEFKYLGVIVTNDGRMKREVEARIGAGNRCYSSLIELLKKRSISRATKLRLYNSIVRPIILYGCETWALTKAMENRFEVLENKILRRILGPVYDSQRQEWRIRHNWEIREQTKQPHIKDVIRLKRLKWAGHIARMQEDRWPKRVFSSGVHGRRPLGRPRKDWRRCVDEDVQICGIEPREWKEVAQDRRAWRDISKAVMDHQVARRPAE